MFLLTSYGLIQITSTSPLTALISTKSPITSFAVAHLDGTTDWMVAQRQALLAWTGDSLLVQPTMNHKLSLAHWGNTKVGGRGLIAVVGKGQVYQLGLKEGETYVAHPSNIVAYIITTHPPLPYRFKTNILSLDIPNLGISKLLPDTRFFNAMRDSDTWKNLKSALFAFRTWSRRTIWGDRLFLQFRGPMTILLQSRASRVADSLTARDVNEIVDSEPGAVNTAVTLIEKRLEPPKKEDGPVQSNDPTALKIASVGKEGKVSFEETNSFESLEKR
ncbi:MAG: Altered inheritance of mitochondria protein 24, mitochondrial [Vezdaea aestivalis]|nr:MAG: Altered inheritance of mitochondria protein 24, mitochondrial [Vezdaea aestivalis]